MRFRVHSNYGTTGGHQSAHQVGAAIRDMGYDSSMVYPPIGEEGNYRSPDAVVPLWRKLYSLESFVAREELEDEPDSVHLLPAGWGPNWWPVDPNSMSCLRAHGPDPYKSIKVLWWLGLGTWQNWDIGGWDRPMDLSHPNIPKLYHACQSRAAYDFIVSNTSLPPWQVFMLHDYTHDFWLHSEIDLYRLIPSRRDVVLFNPVKGPEETRAIMEACSGDGIDFRPITGMTREQIREAGRSAKVYIDFGTHPGRDRIPREMAACGCSVITGSDGTAACTEDVPLRTRKFARSDDAYDCLAVRERILADVKYYPSALFDDEMVEYRRVIRQERSTVFAEVRNMVDTVAEHGRIHLRGWI